MALTAICGACLIFSAACASHPKNETVTTPPRSARSATTNAPSVLVGTPQQSSVTADRNLEAAGDDVARALVRLGQRNRRAAVEALDEARLILRTRVTDDIPMGTEGDRLRSQVEEVAREITEARTQIEHGDINGARKGLLKINNQLDNLHAKS